METRREAAVRDESFSRRALARRLLAYRASQRLAVAGLGLLSALWILTPHFLTVSNALNVMEQTSINAIVAIGMTFVIISGGIDLSVGSLVAVAGVVLAGALKAGWPIPVAIAAGLAIGAATGLINGIVIAFGRLPPFIMTLGMMSVARGAALLMTDGRPISGFDASFRSIATGRIAGVPAPIVLTLALYAVSHFVLSRTRFGRYVYGIGGNEEATRLSGVNVRLHKTMVYVVSGVMSAIAAVLLTARLNSAQPIAGIMRGSTPSRGRHRRHEPQRRRGHLGGTLIGALTMGVLRNGLNLLGYRRSCSGS
jgi:ribose transport system permease protein